MFFRLYAASIQRLVSAFSTAGTVCRHVRRGVSWDSRFGPEPGMVALLGRRLSVDGACPMQKRIDLARLDPGVRDLRILAR